MRLSYFVVMEENIADEYSYIPQVGDDRIPKIGMKFESLDAAFFFYNQYARESGFSARISNSKKSKKTNEVIWKNLYALKKGKRTTIIDGVNKNIVINQERKELVEKLELDASPEFQL